MRNYKHTPELAGTLTAYHFPSTSVSLFFGDWEIPVTEGYVHFDNAFYQEEGRFTVVYTEHLGYFVFIRETVVSVIGQKGPEQLTKSVQDMLDNPLDTDL
jgi:hypothetical protein